MKIDIQKANAAIDEYVKAIQDPHTFPMREASLYVAKARLERHGVIPSSRALDLMDHCVLWTACIIACKRVREISRLEVEHRAVRPGRSLEKTLNRWRKGRGFEGVLSRLNQHLADSSLPPL